MKLIFVYIYGAALLIPMVIMKLVPGTVCALVTTVASVFILSSIVVTQVPMAASEILMVTAAYTAVLVVFVGSTTT